MNGGITAFKIQMKEDEYSPPNRAEGLPATRRSFTAPGTPYVTPLRLNAGKAGRALSEAVVDLEMAPWLGMDCTAREEEEQQEEAIAAMVVQIFKQAKLQKRSLRSPTINPASTSSNHSNLYTSLILFVAPFQ